MEYWSDVFNGIKDGFSAFSAKYSSTPVLHHSIWMLQTGHL